MTTKQTRSQSKKKGKSLLLPKLDNILIKEYLLKNYPHARTNLMDVRVQISPEETKITIYTTKPGILIGNKGVYIKNIKQDLIRLLNTSKINVSVEDNPSKSSAMIYACQITRLLEKTDLNVRRICSFIQRDIKEENSDVLGSYIKVSGKFRSGSHSRSTIFRVGQMKYSGNVFDVQVEEGVSYTIPALGALGVVVRLYRKAKRGSHDQLIFRSHEEMTAANNQKTKKKEDIKVIDIFDSNKQTKMTGEENDGK